jgi:L-methionine (R)-S-oxide reductase
MSEARAGQISYDDKALFYRELLSEIIALADPSPIATLANASATIKQHLPDINWAGFYLFDGKELVLGPFQGLPACIRIAIGRGVCGTSASQLKSLLVADVHEFPGHIACDAASRSELVVPIVKDGKLYGVLDIDSPSASRFDKEDQLGFEKIIEELKSLLTPIVY